MEASPDLEVSPDLVLSLVLCLLLRLSGKFHVFDNHRILHGFFRVDPGYLDSLVEVLTTPADPAVGFVQEAVLSECRWPLRFGDLPSTLPQLWSVWTSVYKRALDVRGPSLKVLACAALVLSRRCLRHLLQLAPASSAMGTHGMALSLPGASDLPREEDEEEAWCRRHPVSRELSM